MEVPGQGESSASRECEQDATLNPAAGIVPEWPLLADELKLIRADAQGTDVGYEGRGVRLE